MWKIQQKHDVWPDKKHTTVKQQTRIEKKGQKSVFFCYLNFNQQTQLS